MLVSSPIPSGVATMSAAPSNNASSASKDRPPPTRTPIVFHINALKPEIVQCVKTKLVEKINLLIVKIVIKYDNLQVALATDAEKEILSFQSSEMDIEIGKVVNIRRIAVFVSDILLISLQLSFCNSVYNFPYVLLSTVTELNWILTDYLRALFVSCNFICSELQLNSVLAYINPLTSDL